MIDLLEQNGYPIDAAAWIFGIEWEEWRLLLAFRDYSKLGGMLGCLNIIDEVIKPEWSSLKSAVMFPVNPNLYIVRQLREMIKRVRMPDVNTWTLRNRVDGLSIEKAWLYRLFPAKTPTAQE